MFVKRQSPRGRTLPILGVYLGLYLMELNAKGSSKHVLLINQ